MLVACPLAGLSALETHYAASGASAQFASADRQDRPRRVQRRFDGDLLRALGRLKLLLFDGPRNQHFGRGRRANVCQGERAVARHDDKEGGRNCCGSSESLLRRMVPQPSFQWLKILAHHLAP